MAKATGCQGDADPGGKGLVTVALLHHRRRGASNCPAHRLLSQGLTSSSRAGDMAASEALDQRRRIVGCRGQSIASNDKCADPNHFPLKMTS
jgi:hypothetical protein